MYQLRVGLSPLRYHKRNFKDTHSTLCSCNAADETTEHFLLHCTNHTEARRNMFEVIDPILEDYGLHFTNNALEKFLLYGSQKLTDNINKVVLNETLKFIKDSSRF